VRGPERVAVRMYQVGFGDCFLLSFGYAKALPDGRDERHVLVDFGSTNWPKGHRQRYVQIADDVAARCGGKLDAVVITHRHKDRLSGFGDAKAAATIAGLQPSLVVRPWTEDPQLAEDASGPGHLDARTRRFAANLREAQALTARVADAVGDSRRGLRGTLAELAFDQLHNEAAIGRLDALAGAAEHGGRYVFAGEPSGIEDVVPGLKVTVLGPPTPQQWPRVTGEASDDPEYWLAWRGLLDRMVDAVGAAPGAQVPGERAPAVEPGPVRWLVERMRDQEAHSLLRLVRNLDDAMNNTSVILLFKVGERRLLFPGDAQIENWSYALGGPPAKKLARELAAVDLYKVGHHGSRNASPKTLVKLWQARDRAAPLTSMMSTLPGVHGESEATRVPRSTLVTALEALGPLTRTDALPKDALWVELTGSLTAREPFAVVTG
jgi:hypothetical protein